MTLRLGARRTPPRGAESRPARPPHLPTPHLEPHPHPRLGTGQWAHHLPCSAPPTASAVRSRALPQLRPASRLVTQQRRAAFLPEAICAASGVWPRTAMKKRKTVAVRASCTGQGFMERCSSRAAVPSTRAAPHCGQGGRASAPVHARGPAPHAPRAHPHGAPSQRAGPLHQAVGVRVVGAEPLLRESQQGGPRGHGQQGRHAVRQASPLALEEHGPRRDMRGPHALRAGALGSEGRF